MPLMFQAVVMTTEQLQVGELGLPSLPPGDDVIDIAPARGAVTTGVPAAPIPDHHRPPQGRGNDPGLSPHVDRFGIRSHDHPGERGITEQSLQVGLGELGPLDGLSGPAQLIPDPPAVDQDDEMGFLASGFGQPPRVHRLPAEIDQGIGLV